MYSSSLRFAALAVLSAAFACPVLPQTTEPASEPRRLKKEPDTAIRDWISRDVSYIATESEKKAFRQLTTDEERENFIATFWRLRDPDPDTEENEYRLQYYERIAYANEHFSSGKPGWMTDRGRIYITWGAPDSIESRPSGGSYDRPAWEGGGTTTAYPFEIWFYRSRDGLPTGVEFEFVDPSGSGEYRLTIDPDEKDAMRYVPGLGRTDAGRNVGANDRRYMREQDSPFIKLENVIRASSAPPVAGSLLTQTKDDSPVFDNNPLEFDVRIDFFRQSEERVISTFTVVAKNSELSFADAGGIPTANLNILGRITSVSEQSAGRFEDRVTATAPDPGRIADQSSIYQEARSLAPGRYKVNVTVTDLNSGNRGKRTLGFEVPDYSKGSLSSSTMILASTLRPSTDAETGARFVIGGLKVVPNMSGVFRRGSELGVFLQVYNFSLDQTTLRPAVDAEYVVTRNGIEVLREKHVWSDSVEVGKRITLSRLFDTSRLEPGEYKLSAVIHDNTQESGGTITPTAVFTIIE